MKTRLAVTMIMVTGVLSMSACFECKVGALQGRLGETERTIAIGESFIATYEQGGSCDKVFTPVTEHVRWTSAETTIVAVDSMTGQVTGLRRGDALIVPNAVISTGPWSVLVHVR
jgi:hypothetical protein